MQGWGQLVNQTVLVVFLLIFNGSHGNPPYSEAATQWTYRLSFAFILFFTVYMLYLRIWKVQHFDRALQAAKRQGSVTGYDMQSAKLALSHYGGRVIATAFGWFASDFFFYGSKLFQGNFIKVIDPGATVMTGWLYNLINCGVSLVGYYMAAWLIDSKLYGRVTMQCVGFFFMFLVRKGRLVSVSHGPNVPLHSASSSPQPIMRPSKLQAPFTSSNGFTTWPPSLPSLAPTA